jgi:phospholipid/cholesterol/gamma-HCH transport system substrate-binding protein
MEIRARYVQMGAFTLAVIAAGFAFVFWLKNTGGLRERTVYRIQFESPVSGLLKGSAVLFNGIRVGEVTSLDLSSANPRQVMATVAIERATPVHKDTTGIDFQGADGIACRGADGRHLDRPLLAAPWWPPVLVADPARQSMSQWRARCCAAWTPCSPRMPSRCARRSATSTPSRARWRATPIASTASLPASSA